MPTTWWAGVAWVGAAAWTPPNPPCEALEAVGDTAADPPPCEDRSDPNRIGMDVDVIVVGGPDPDRGGSKLFRSSRRDGLPGTVPVPVPALVGVVPFAPVATRAGVPPRVPANRATRPGVAPTPG